MSSKKTQFAIAIIAVIGFSAATAFVVHHNDTTKNSQAMMASVAMQKKEVLNAATDAAMKQAETDKMAAHDTMMHQTAPSTTPTGQ